MSEIRIAHRYAKSILDLAVDQNKLDQVSQDMEYLKGAFQSRELFNLIKSPIINKGKKLEIFSKLFSGNISELTSLFLTRVIKKGRESIIPEMMGSFQDQYNEKSGVIAVKLTTTSTMSEQTLQAVKKEIDQLVGSGKSATIEVVHDESLIGGYVVEYEDKRFDASVKHQLENIKKSFSA